MRARASTGRLGGRVAAMLLIAVWFCVSVPVPAWGQASEAEEAKYGPRKLESEIYQVSYIEASLGLETLGSLGYTTGPPTAPLSLDQLPVIFLLPDTKADTVVAAKDKLNPATDTSPQQRLMILYHSSQVEELAKLKRLLGEKIDVPGRLVLIEALVMELSEAAVRELGLQYEASGPHWTASFKTDATTGETTLETVGERLFGAVGNARAFQATLKAIIDEQKGEVLSSPSVLTVDNRQARITIVEDVPIIESTVVTGGTTQVQVRFEQVGISLNIKPRISRDGSWVSLQIQTEVSEAPLEDYLVVGGERVAPLINRRKVETIARVKNNTPFLIGGLIRNERGESVERIPIISRIPIMGKLFQIRSDRKEKREVIIVVTPRVLETEGANRPILPMDSARFDFLDNRLFRNSYRLKAEDVFDLEFITSNDRVGGIIRRARTYLERHPERIYDPLFSEFGRGRIPGEEAFVIRMTYEIIKKLEVQKNVSPERMIFLCPDETKPAGFRIAWLKNVFAEHQGKGRVHPLDRPYPKDVLLLRYKLRRNEGVKELLTEQVADWEWVPVESREEAETLLYECSRTQGLVRDRAAVLLADRKDLVRLQTAVAIRETVKVNSAEAVLNLQNFQVGRRVVMPELDPSGERIFLIEYDVADYFFQSDFYYETFQDIFRNSYEGIRDVLEREGL